jgi:glycosyltransferase involved in cell wall biosynthesis
MHIAVNAHLLSPVGGYRQAGVSRYIEQLLRRLLPAAPEDRWTVYVAPGAASRVAVAPNVRVRPSRLPTTNPLARIFWEQFVAPAALLRDPPAVLFCPLNVVPFAARCPTVVCVHDLAFIRFPEQRGQARRRYLTALTRLSVRRAAHVVTVSEWTRREVIDLLGVAPDRVTTTPNGGDERLGPLDPAAVTEFRRARSLPDQFLLFLSTLEPRKNIETLLRAYARRRDEIGMPLVIAGGKGWFYEPIFRLAEELHLGDAVRFPGFVPGEELGLWYNAATAFVYPSLYEGFGLPPLEAMQCGTPVITSTAASLPEVAGDAALLVEPTDVDSLAAALARVASDPGLRDDLRARGLRQARQFSWERSATTTLAVLRAVADG